MNAIRRTGMIAIALASLAWGLPAEAQVVTTTAADGTVTTKTNTATPPPSFMAGLDEIGKALTTSTNWALIGGYGHSLGGSSRNLLFGDLAYNFNDYVGLVLGYDYLWDSGGHEFNSVKGGATLQLPMHPFAFLGSTFLTNVVATPFVADLIAQAQGNSAVANLVTTGVNVNLYSWKNFELGAGAQYEKRTGDGRFDGDYLLFHGAISRNF